MIKRLENVVNVKKLILNSSISDLNKTNTVLKNVTNLVEINMLNVLNSILLIAKPLMEPLVNVLNVKMSNLI